MSKTWRPIPLHTLVYETLKACAPCTDDELMRSLKKENNDIGSDILNKILLRLEIRGLIQVSNATKGKKKIEIRKR